VAGRQGRCPEYLTREESDAQAQALPSLRRKR
jgi:hypothetical protein